MVQADGVPFYMRPTRRLHLATSDPMYESKGRDLEEILPDFVQLA